MVNVGCENLKHRLTLVPHAKRGTGFVKVKHASAGFFVSLRMTLLVMLSVSETSRGNGSGFKHRLTLVPHAKGGTGNWFYELPQGDWTVMILTNHKAANITRLRLKRRSDT